jgi:two-component system LytT family response regulator
MIKALIIDDEKHCSDNLQWQLNQYCPEVEVISICNNAEEGLNEIYRRQPQLIFLDVEMPGMNGFELLEKLTKIDFDIVFTTAFNQYAIRAIKFGALDYLVKPVDRDELCGAVYKIINRTRTESLKQFTALLTHIRKSNDLSFQKIALPTLHGYELVPLNNITYCESKSNYTNIYLNNSQQILVSRTLKDIQELLDAEPFFRIHNSYLVNLQYAVRYTRGEGGFLVLNNDITLPVSRNKKEELLKLITHLSA